MEMTERLSLAQREKVEKLRKLQAVVKRLDVEREKATIVQRLTDVVAQLGPECSAQR